jgi:NADP-dependent 3-hydroxy acid dehydrogenase YdfG
MSFRVLDPTHEKAESGIKLASRLSSLAGQTVGFISNGKEGTKAFFAELERDLREQVGVKDVVWRTKSNYSAPADSHIVDEVRRWQAVITGVGD